jgi:hypothetical protein
VARVRATVTSGLLPSSSKALVIIASTSGFSSICVAWVGGWVGGGEVALRRLLRRARCAACFVQYACHLFYLRANI